MVRGSGLAVLYLLSVHGSLTEGQMRKVVPYTSLLRALGDLEQAGFVMRPDGVATEVSEGRARTKRMGVGVWFLTPVGQVLGRTLRTLGDQLDSLDLENLPTEGSSEPVTGPED